VKYVARTLIVCLIAYTALAMAMNPSFKHIALAWVGPFPLYIFDALLVGAIAAYFYSESLRPQTDPNPDNRAVLRLTSVYVLYQIVVVMPIAALVFGVHLGDAYSYLDARFALALIPFVYTVGLRYLSPERIIDLVNIAALALLLYALYRYTFIGPQGEWDEGEFRLRVLWGGSSLLFGWLVFTGLFLSTRGFRAYVMGLAGILGIALVNHRSAYVALIFALLAQLVMSRRVTKRIIALVIAAILLGVFVGTVSPTFRESATYSLRTMFNPQADVTARDRVERSSLAWDYVQEHPLGDYVWNHRYYLVDLGTEGFAPHNFIIATLDTQGWISACLVFALIACILWIGWKNRGRSRLSTAMTSYLVFYLTFCLFNTTWDSVENITLFVFAVALVLDANRMTSGITTADEVAS
jgi:O-antigen ligase